MKTMAKGDWKNGGRTWGLIGALFTSAMLTSGFAGAVDYDMFGTVNDDFGDPVNNAEVVLTNVDDSLSTSAYTDSDGDWQEEASSISLDAGETATIMVTGSVPCSYTVSVPIDQTATYPHWTPQGHTTLTMPTLALTPDNVVDGGSVSSSWGNGVVTVGMAFDGATLSNGVFDATVDFAFVDTNTGGQNEWRSYNFELTATYVGYLDKDCQRQAAGPTALGSDTSYIAPQLYQSQNGVSDGDTITMTGLDGTHGQPADATFIIVELDAHVISLRTANPPQTPADVTFTLGFLVVNA